MTDTASGWRSVQIAERVRPRAVVDSVDALVAGATSREPMKTADSLSGSAFERLEIGGERFVLKYLHVDDDWIQRASGDLVTRPLVAWTSGLFDALPDCLDHTIVGMAGGLGRNGWGSAVLMTDVSEHLVDVGAGTIPFDQHRTFLEHMAELHATFWDFTDEVGLMPMGNRLFALSPLMVEVETELGATDGVPTFLGPGSERMAQEAPRAGALIARLRADPYGLMAALERTPQTLVHSDWKAGNLGSHPDGRTILIDWAFPGRAPAATDLAWYLAVNCDLLPEPKEDAIDAYRAALESRGVDTAGWWDVQLELCLLAAFVLLGWSKAGAELAWWTERIERALPHLG